MTDYFSGFLHPLIHLGFGVEFKQPAIIAEALAEAASHDVWISAFLQGAEKAAKGKRSSKSMVELLDEIRADLKLSTAAHWDDGNKIRDGVMKRAPDEMIKYASQWIVEADQLEERTAEMINAAGMPDHLSPLAVLSNSSLKSTIPVVPSILRNRLSLTSTTCTASTARSSSPPF